VADGVFDENIIPEHLAAYLADPRHHLLVALDGDLVVAKLSAVHYMRPDNADCFYIDEVDVSPDYRQQGIAKGLMEYALRLAKSIGCQECWLGTEHDNEAANALYRSLDGKDQAFILYEF